MLVGVIVWWCWVGWGLGGVLAGFGHGWWCRVRWGGQVSGRVFVLFSAGVVGVLAVWNGLVHGARRGLWGERRLACGSVFGRVV